MNRFFRLYIFVFIAAGICMPAISFAGERQKRPAPRNFPKPFTVMVPVRDGKKLAADVFLPSDEGKFPTIFIFTPYSRKRLTAAVPYAAKKSRLLDREHYVFVCADWRGFYGSKAAAVQSKKGPFKQVGEDGHDIVEWIAKQKWSNGKVGMWGASALGVAQYQTAVEKPPHLVCIVPVVARYGVSYEESFHGGVLKYSHVFTRDQVGFEGSAEKIKKQPVYGRWWKFVERLTTRDIGKLDIPVFVIGGWYDIDTEPVMKVFELIRKDAGDEARKNVRMLIGPWDHCDAAAGKLKVGELKFPKAEKVSEREAHRFFNYWMRGMKDNGWGNESTIRYFQMGERKWYKLDSWPPKGITDKTFYIRAGGELSSEPENSSEVEPDTYKFDPSDPSPTIGGLNLASPWKRDGLKVATGPKDQRSKVESRKDCFTYTTEKLGKNLAVKGIVKVKLFVSSDRKDTDFMVRLSDVYPDNRSMLITDGAHRMRYRNSMIREDFMKPGGIYEVTVRLSCTAHTFLAGHRVRIIVSSSNFPRFAVNPNDGGHFLEKDKKGLVATNSIYHDATYKSLLILPVAGTAKK